jgi:malyl-CoA/(S)-citramalyl-CoA lyase
MNSDRTTRTYLAVPAHRSRLVESAARSESDAVFLDLEDAVPEAEKSHALEGACAALKSLDWGAKTVAVRINYGTSAAVENEVKQLTRLERLDALIIPKAESVSVISCIAEWVVAEQARIKPLELELLIETATGLARAEGLAGFHPMISALHLGVGDLAASLGSRAIEIGASPEGYCDVRRAGDGIVVTPLDFFAFPMMQVLIAARAHGLRAIDGPSGDYKDSALTAARARRAAAMGYDGKQVIHPDQIIATRNAFIPSCAELACALRVKAAIREAEARGLGAVTVDGKMIDAANIRMVDRLVRMAGDKT